MKVNFWRGVGLSSEMLYETMCSSFCDNDKSETTGAIYSLSSPVSATVRKYIWAAPSRRSPLPGNGGALRRIWLLQHVHGVGEPEPRLC